jgi:hypothetical protein
MKRLKMIFYWLFGIKKTNLEQIQKLTEKEEAEIKDIQKSVAEIKVISEEISSKLQKCSTATPKKELVINPRLSTSEVRRFLIKNDVLQTKNMSRKERQFYAKKIHFLRRKVGMKIVFDKTNKSYKYSLNEN